ncbi:MAG: hypothetical protein AAFQ63_16920 [Cyanobacteria bacterium J06621_11]
MGIGWPTEFIGSARINLNESSQLGHTFQHTLLVVVDNVESETRFQDTTFLQQCGIVSDSIVFDIAHRRNAEYGY